MLHSTVGHSVLHSTAGHSVLHSTAGHSVLHSTVGHLLLFQEQIIQQFLKSLDVEAAVARIRSLERMNSVTVCSLLMSKTLEMSGGCGLVEVGVA